MDSICHKPAWELVQHIAAGELSPLELMEATLRRMDAVNPKLNAFIALNPERALDQARSMTEAMAGGHAFGPLAGIPLGVKDLEDVNGMVTSFGSVPFKDNVATRDSVQVARLRAAGAIVVGKTNTPEFGFTGFTKNRLHGTTRNPWNLDLTPGGSSGGSAAAVAGGLVPLCTGSDAGGSIRIPAAYSGCFGMKPTLGRIPLGPRCYQSFSALETLGPLTRSVTDAALYLDCTSGHHPCDPHSLPRPEHAYLKTLDDLPKNLTLAFSPDLGYARVEKNVMARVEKAVQAFEEMGHTVELRTVALPDAGDAWLRLICTDIYAQLGKHLERNREKMGRSLVAAIDQAKGMSIKELSSIQALRWRLNQQLMDLFQGVDLLLTPTMPTSAFAANGPPPVAIDGHPIPLLGAVAFTYPFNFSGHPAASVPAGLTKNATPVGLQIIGPRHGDALVLQAARAYEKIRPWNTHWPDL
ncbi:MAG: amidase [Desulfobacterium sp.]|nr:amidase [Desulfobacterium sp.]